jgi:hypothetical protein
MPPGPPDTSSAQLSEAAAALFEEAHRRARRRRRRIAIVGLALVLIAAAVGRAVMTRDGSAPTRPASPGPLTVEPKRLLLRPSFLGVSCPRPNSIACDRVGLAIWTLDSARAARATIAGHSFELTDDPRHVGPHQPGQPRMFVGFLHHAGLRHGPLAVRVENGRSRWTGIRPVDARVRLVITLADRSQQETSLSVPLQPGWG